jgi:hypothetical protein
MEPGGRRVEYHFDRERKEWSGYSVDGRQEVYYAFRAAGDRAYAIEEAATQGAVSAQAAAEFDRIMAAFRCEAR